MGTDSSSVNISSVKYLNAKRGYYQTNLIPSHAIDTGNNIQGWQYRMVAGDTQHEMSPRSFFYLQIEVYIVL